MLQDYLKISDEVQTSMNAGTPVVALESTIISHGMPYPKNVETAKNVASAVRANGAVPATIAIMHGKLCVGLDTVQLEALGKSGVHANKISRRDIPFALCDSAMVGGTTVAATMIIASLAGIRVFATGGIGGVHRGAQQTFDVSADLQELAQTNVAVVCAGAKSILDIGLTREYLETHGVPVVGYQTDCWPAFYTRRSEFEVDYQLNEPAAVADVLSTKWRLGLDGGVLVCVPVPKPWSMDEAEINSVIADALLQADLAGVKGKEVTPFLLAKITEITGGDSLAANIELVLNNARVAAQIASAMVPYVA